MDSKTHPFAIFYLSRSSLTPVDTQSLIHQTGENPISEPVRTAHLATLVLVPIWICECFDANARVGTSTYVVRDVQRRLLAAVHTVKPLYLPE